MCLVRVVWCFQCYHILHIGVWQQLYCRKRDLNDSSNDGVNVRKRSHFHEERFARGLLTGLGRHDSRKHQASKNRYRLPRGSLDIALRTCLS